MLLCQRRWRNRVSHTLVPWRHAGLLRRVSTLFPSSVDTAYYESKQLFQTEDDEQKQNRMDALDQRINHGISLCCFFGCPKSDWRQNVVPKHEGMVWGLQIG